MTELQIRAVDPGDPAAFDAYYDAYAAALQHGPTAEFATVWQRDELRAMLAAGDERRARLGWSALVDHRVVAIGWLEASYVDNTDLAQVDVCVVPRERGRGHAAAVLAHVEDHARADGRSRLVGEVRWPWSQGADGTGSPELTWARRQGFELGLVDVQRRLSLPVDPSLLESFASGAAAHHQGYELRVFTGRLPDDIVEGWARLDATLMTEAPMGDIEREAETADVEAVRAQEALLADQQRTPLHAVAFAPDGELVAYSDLVLTAHEPDRAYQWGTLVRPDHRGHRLGLAVKTANLRHLQDTEPQVTTVVTYNAEVNAPMVAVNDQLGFRPVQWLGEVQKQLD